MVGGEEFRVFVVLGEPFSRACKHGAMDPLDERPQIGPITINTGSLDDAGWELATIVSELGLQLTGELPVAAPHEGWRVLTSNEGEATVIGAPDEENPQEWWLGQISHAQTDPSTRTLNVDSTTLPRRRSRKDRSTGLMLRWPEVTRSEPDLDLLAIDVVNAGSERWLPQGDSFLVFAAFRQLGGPVPPLYYAYVAGQTPALPLDPGEYARVRVIIDAGQWAAVQPGRYEVHAFLVDLSVHVTDPLVVGVTAHDVQRHLPRRPVPGPPPPPR